MSSLGSYYYLTGSFFLILAICDIAFYSTFKTCPIDSSAAGLFLILAITNISLLILLLMLGYLVNLFDQLDPEEMLNMGWFKKLLGILCKVLPSVCKILHYLKVLLVLICAYYGYFNNTSGVSYLTDPDFDNTTLTDSLCKTNSTELQNFVSNYSKQVVVFESIEFSAVIFTLCILGMIKNFINIDGYFHEPDDNRHGKCRKFLFRRFGP
jgi:hypothetical protein